MLVRREGVSLAPLTTLGIGGPARALVEATSEAEIVEAVRGADVRGEPVLVLGGGSNLVVGDAGFDGLVVRLASRGIDARREGGTALVDVAAGEPWDDFVARAVEEGWSGVECLSGIPGLVGATPIQNVGAYGQDVGETLVRLRAYDRRAGEVVTIAREACGLGYRASRFKGDGRFVVTGVTFALAERGDSAPVRYAELARALGVEPGTRAPLATVRTRVIALRRGKGMVLDASDPDSRSAGSFFVNPVLDAGAMVALEARVRARGIDVASVPRFPEDGGRTKVAAAWLIERAGFGKGYGVGRVGVSTKHALALVNRGGASASELFALAREIEDGVERAFGVRLGREPVAVG